MVYYRKYRPQTISELDLSSVREKLTAILSSKSLPHAFLFTGSKGLGKTSSARILAKAINCKRNDLGSSILDINNTKKGPISNIQHPISNFEPCNKCDACLSITNGSNIDVLEIDAASNGGVEEIRTLRERIKFSPSTLKYKVYIIDEVHMLSTGAFNALLKTLEEPPSHVIFILATTELHKLPETVVSRTFQVKFEKPTEEELVNSLERIVKGEKLKVEKGVLILVYKMAEGSFRDGAKLLEELALASSGGEITKELFEKLYKSGGINDEVYELLKAYSARDSKKALEIIDILYKSGADFKAVIARIVDHLRGILMLRNDIKSEEVDVVGLTVMDIKNLLTLANEAYSELGLSIIPQLPLELMTVKYCVIDAKEDESRIGSQELRVKPEEVAREAPKPKTTNKNLLHDLMEKVNENNKPGAALLRSCRGAVIDGKIITITTPFPIHAERLTSEKVFPDLQKAANLIAGEVVEVQVIVLLN